jgi:hypothetical protein
VVAHNRPISARFPARAEVVFGRAPMTRFVALGHSERRPIADEQAITRGSKDSFEVPSGPPPPSPYTKIAAAHSAFSSVRVTAPRGRQNQFAYAANRGLFFGFRSGEKFLKS